MAGLDLSALRGIDVHVHVETDSHGRFALDEDLRAAAARYFKGDITQRFRRSPLTTARCTWRR